MKTTIAAAALSALAPFAASAVVDFNEEVSDDLSGVATDNVFSLGVGLNSFVGGVGEGECRLTVGGLARCEYDDLADAFRVELGAGHKITSIIASAGFGSMDGLKDQVGPQMFDFLIEAPQKACKPSAGSPCMLMGTPWSAKIEVSQVPLPATGLLFLGGLAALGAASRRRRAA